MAEICKFEPNTFEIYRDAEGERFRLEFSNPTGEVVTIMVRQAQLAGLVAALQSNISPNTAVPIDRDSMRAGLAYRLRGVRVAPLPDGGSTMTISLFLPDQDREVSLPLRLEQKDVASLILNLSGILPK